MINFSKQKHSLVFRMIKGPAMILDGIITTLTLCFFVSFFSMWVTSRTINNIITDLKYDKIFKK